VPLGQRLVIEYLSAECNFGLPDSGDLVVITNGTTVPHHFTFTQGANQVGKSAGLLVKLYADPGTKVQTPVQFCNMSVSGRLVNI
jgi:hypothetical protein